MASYNQKFSQQPPNAKYPNYSSSEGEEEEDNYDQFNNQRGQYGQQHEEEDDDYQGHEQGSQDQDQEDDQDYQEGQEEEDEHEEGEEQVENDEDDEENDYRYQQQQNHRGQVGEEEDEQQESYTNNMEYKQQKEYYSNQHQINEQTEEDDEDNQVNYQNNPLENDSDDDQINQNQQNLRQQIQLAQQKTKPQVENYKQNQKQIPGQRFAQQYDSEEELERQPASKHTSLKQNLKPQQNIKSEKMSSDKKMQPQTQLSKQYNSHIDKENSKNKGNIQKKAYQYSDDEEEDDEQEEQKQLSHKYNNNINNHSQKQQIQQQQDDKRNGHPTSKAQQSFGEKRPMSGVQKQSIKRETESLNNHTDMNAYTFNQQSYEDQIADLKRKMQQNLEFNTNPNQKRLQIESNNNQNNQDEFNNFVQEDGNSSENSFDQYNSHNIGKENYLAPKMKHLQNVPRPKSSYIVSNNSSSMQSNQQVQNLVKAPHPYLKKGSSTATLGQSRVNIATTHNNFNNSKYASNVYSNHSEIQDQQLERPKTAASTFKPIYKVSMNEFKMKNKQFDYTNKNFKTIPKKSDPVSRFQSMQQTWKSNKFLKSTNNTSTASGSTAKEGRKLNLSERIQSSKPESMFYRYMTKNDIINQYV